MLLNIGKEYITLRIGSDISSPVNFAIGTGSGTILASRTTMFNESDRQVFTGGSIDFSTTNKLTFQSNWNSVEMSGTLLSEIAIVDVSTANTGSVWSLNVIPTLTFDGTNELQTEETWFIY